MVPPGASRWRQGGTKMTPGSTKIGRKGREDGAPGGVKIAKMTPKCVEGALR